MDQTMKKVLSLALCGLIVPAASFAEVFTAEAFNNLTVRPTGPRPGSSGLAFFNVQGTNNGTNASFAVAEVQPSAFNLSGSVIDLTRFSVNVTASNAAFTINGGPIDVWVTEDNTTSFAQSGMDIFFDVNFLPGGLGNQLAPVTQIGTFEFNPLLPTGTLYQVDMTTIPSALEAYLLGRINSDLPIRLVFTAGNDSLNGTFAGYTNFNNQGPTIEIDAVVGGANQTLSGTLNLNDTVFGGAYTRTITGTVKQGATTIGTITVNSINASSVAFSGDIPASATGAATIEWDGGSFLLRKTNITLTGSNLAVGTVSMQNGDVDNSGEVDAADIDEVIANFGSGADINSDVDVSGEVDAADIDIVIANFGGTDD